MLLFLPAVRCAPRTALRPSLTFLYPHPSSFIIIHPGTSVPSPLRIGRIMQPLFSLCLGVALAAACGFRVFIPFFFFSLAALVGWIHPAPGFHWIATVPALVLFALAAALEALAYFIPWIDNLLDPVVTPVAVVAGALIAAAAFAPLPFTQRWLLALLLGASVATAVQLTTVALRIASTASTAGFANPLIAGAELAAALFLTLLALIVPPVAAFFVVGLIILIVRAFLRKRFHRPRFLFPSS